MTKNTHDFLETDKEILTYAQSLIADLLEEARQATGYTEIELKEVNDSNYSYSLSESMNLHNYYVMSFQEIEEHVTRRILDKANVFINDGHREHLYISQILSPSWHRCEVLNQEEYNNEFQTDFDCDTNTLLLVLKF